MRFFPLLGFIAGLHVWVVLQHGSHQVGAWDVPVSGQALLQMLGASEETLQPKVETWQHVNRLRCRVQRALIIHKSCLSLLLYMDVYQHRSEAENVKVSIKSNLITNKLLSHILSSIRLFIDTCTIWNNDLTWNTKKSQISRRVCKGECKSRLLSAAPSCPEITKNTQL